MSFTIVTDTSANLPTPLLNRQGIAAIPFTYIVKRPEMNCTSTEA